MMLAVLAVLLLTSSRPAWAMMPSFTMRKKRFNYHHHHHHHHLFVPGLALPSLIPLLLKSMRMHGCRNLIHHFGVNQHKSAWTTP